VSTVPKYAFLDLDGTLVRSNLAHVSVHHQARRQTLIGRAAALASFAVASPGMLALDFVSRSAFQEVLYTGFRGISEDRLRFLGEHAAEHVYHANLRSGVDSFLAGLRRAGLEPVLVTGSLAHVVGPFAARLGIEKWAANRLDVRDNLVTGRLVPPVMSGARKAKWMRELCEETGALLADCHAYSDSAADLPMLAAVGHPCAVHPDRALLLEARAMQWPVIMLDEGRPADESIVRTDV
jgi:HAD superfamily hydrolase (TIGR01490 family)